MFVRFRAIRHRLIVDLVATRRISSKVVSEHIARLGSAALPEPVAAAERILFWSRLRERWRMLANQLSNRVSADDRRQALAAIHKRIPRPSEEEEQAARIEAARSFVASDERLRGSCSDKIADQRKTIALCEARIAEEHALIDKLDREMHHNQQILLELYAGRMIKGGDEAMRDYLTCQADKRDAEIRSAPRPAARGKGRRQWGV